MWGFYLGVFFMRNSRKSYYQKRYILNRDKILTNNKLWQKNNPDKVSIIKLKFKIKNPNYMRDYARNNKNPKPVPMPACVISPNTLLLLAVSLESQVISSSHFISLFIYHLYRAIW